MTTLASLLKRKFTASQVAAVAGMNIETLRVWRRRKHVVLEADGPGWTRFTFNDLMLVVTYHRLVQSHCSHAMAEMIAGHVLIGLKDRWEEVLNADTGVFCFCNMHHDTADLDIQTIFGLEALNMKMSAALRDPERGPAYQIVDCSAVLQNVLTKATALDRDTAKAK
ncbi:MerR family transcriptional regulator [Roseibium polysiphoniae]|uniref:MerR family transcriptional regulator n=1 Tax=Roseibium polysiphoniae TaxID=2571221 RepID=UPI001AD8C6C1